MYHSFSSQSFLKPSHQTRLPQAQHRIQNDITVPKEYQNHNALFEQGSDDSPQKSNFSTRSISKLKKKIKQIKCALKIAEEHNEQLHIKLTEQKKQFQEQKRLIEIEANKYKSLYEMLIENYEGRSLELKEAKKRIKKLEKQESKSNLQVNKEYHSNIVKEANRLREEEETKKLKEMMTEQEVSLEHVRHENKLLREEVVVKNKKISECQMLIQTYQTEEAIAKSGPRRAEFVELLSKCSLLEEDNRRLKKDREIVVTKSKRLEVELESTKHLKDSIEKDLHKLHKEHEQLKLQLILNQRNYESKQHQTDSKYKFLYEDILDKHNQLLKFSYQIQKDFERQLHTMAKEITRRQIIKNSNLQNHPLHS